MSKTIMDYPTVKEQEQVLKHLKHKYGPGIKVDQWNHKDKHLFFEISNHLEYTESMIQADYYAKMIKKTNIKYIQYDRITHQTTELTRDQLFKKRGWILNNHGIIQFYNP